MTAAARKLRRWAAPLLVGLVGLVAFCLSLDVRFVDPRRFDWLFLGGADSSVHFIGWHMFRNEAWTTPLGAIRTFGYPIGTSVALTDSIPILAVLFKGLDPVLPTEFQYIGGWLMCCFMLQGAFAALLVGTVTPRLSLRVLGAALFVVTPLLVQQLTHAALKGHWLIVAALWLYFIDAGRHRRAAVLSGWALLVAVAAGTHPYVAAMVLALSAAAFGRAALRTPAQALKTAVLPFSVLLGVAMMVMWQTGYFVVGGSDLQSGGLGHFSMNLLAPLMPHGSSMLFGPGPFSTATDGQYEGYAYVGAGMLVLLAVSPVIYRAPLTRAREVAAAHLALIVVFVGLTILALSPRVTVGTRTLFEYDERWLGPLTVFRASGRLFWPVYYGLMFGLIAVVVRRASFRVAVSLLAIAVLVQAIDISSTYRATKAWSALQLDQPLQNRFWEAVPAHYRRLILHPTNICAPPNQGLDYRFFAMIAARCGMAINAGYAARYDRNKLVSYCSSFATEMRLGDVSDDELYVTVPDLAPALVGRAQKPLACRRVDGYAVCFTVASYQRCRTCST